MRAVIPPAAPLPPVAGGAPYFSAKLGAWRRPLVSGKTRLDGCGSPATKRRPGNLSLSDRGKIWLGILFWLLIVFSAFAWVVHDLYISGGL